MYRNFLKAIRSIPISEGDDLKSDLSRQVKQEFGAHRNETDRFIVQRAIQDGQRRYHELLHLVPTKIGRNENNADSSQTVDKDSWLNIDDPEDPRGRVGEGWPWEQSHDNGNK